MKKEYALDENKKNIKLRINAGTVTIYRDNIIVPTLYYSDKFEIKEKIDGIKVKQNAALNNSINIGGIVINSCSSSSIVIGDNVTIVNGKVVSGDVVNFGSVDSDDDNIEFAVPQNIDDLSFDISIASGNLMVRDILVKRMEAEINSGTIIMRDVDMLYSKLEVMSGNIDLEICESILNYKASLSAMCGKTQQDHIDTANNVNDIEKRKLNASTMCGDVKVLFKG